MECLRTLALVEFVFFNLGLSVILVLFFCELFNFSEICKKSKSTVFMQ